MSDDVRLWLIRHAPVAGPRGVIHAIDAPADLDDVAALAALRAKLPADALAFASPAVRTLATATALGLRPVAETDFSEQDFGQWTGRRHDDLAGEPSDVYNAFWRAPADGRPPDGESFVEQIARVRNGLTKLPAGDVVLVVHSGTIRAALAIALDLAPEQALRFAIEPLSLTRIDRVAGGWRVVGVNCQDACRGE
jgi:alpha-ribazole phosphatase